MKRTIQFLTVLLLLAVFNSCEKETEGDVGGVGRILITTMVPNADGLSGSAYMQLIPELEDISVTNTYAKSVAYSSVPCVSGSDIYIIPGWGGTTDYMTKYSVVNDQLEKQWEYLLPTESGATNVVIDGDVAYVACSFSAEIIVMNRTEGTLIEQIDISGYGAGDQNPDAACMVVRDNYLYIGLNQMVGGYLPSPTRPYTDVLIIDMESNEVLKMITDSTSGISNSTRPIDPCSIFVDENNDIYVVSVGAWGYMAAYGHYSGVLKIKSGETDFDPDYQFVFNSTAIEGESNLMDYPHAVKYYGDGKLYATINIPAYYGDPVNYIEDHTVIPAEIDLQEQTIKALDFPYSNSYGVAVGLYEEYVVFGLATTTDNGFYTYNPTTGECSSKAVVTTEGYPYTFNSLQ
ncbi:MAG: hypothetical protein PVF73_02205 [Bacteroidales bacterium]|jgi:hypothetical protein